MNEIRSLTDLRLDLGKAADAPLRSPSLNKFAYRIAKTRFSDPIVWVAYPKGSSKNYRCEFNRDTGWDRLGTHGFEPVRLVAMNEDWSAPRFRRVDQIKTMTRSSAITKAGQAKIGIGRQPA